MQTKRREIRDAAKKWIHTVVKMKQTKYDLIVMDKRGIISVPISNSNCKRMNDHQRQKLLGISPQNNFGNNKLMRQRGLFRHIANNNNNNYGRGKCNVTFNNRKSEHLMNKNISIHNNDNNGNLSILDHVSSMNRIQNNNNNQHHQHKKTHPQMTPISMPTPLQIPNNNTFNPLQQPTQTQMDIDENILKFLQSTSNMNMNNSMNNLSNLSVSNNNMNMGNNQTIFNCGNNMNNNNNFTAFSNNNINPIQNINFNINNMSAQDLLQLISISNNNNNNHQSTPNMINNMNHIKFKGQYNPKMVNLLRPPCHFVPNTSTNSPDMTQSILNFNVMTGNNTNASPTNITTNMTHNNNNNGNNNNALNMDDLMSQYSGDTIMSDTHGDFANIELISLLCQAVLKGNGDNDKINKNMQNILQMQNLEKTLLNATNIMNNMPSFNPQTNIKTNNHINNPNNTANNSITPIIANNNHDMTTFILQNIPKLDDNPIQANNEKNPIKSDNNNNTNHGEE